MNVIEAQERGSPGVARHQPQILSTARARYPSAMPLRLRTEAELDAAFAAEHYLLFKHSPTCPISAAAFAEYERWAAAQPESPTGWIEVVQQRPLARAVAERTGIRHESPQAILLAHGEARWNASHGAITAASLDAAAT